MLKRHSITPYNRQIVATTSSLSMLIALGVTTVSHAQRNDEADGETRFLDAVVVTGTATGRSQLESAVAVTRVSGSIIEEFQPTSESDLFRLLPGIQTAGTVGPGGNANIAVRGLPVATGGAPFVQIQEDGIPTVLFGDIQFGNNDYWTNFDSTVESVEALRGGTAGTFASQAPGAVINYISRTGEEESGFVRYKIGQGFDENQVDFRMGGPLSDTVRYHIGGYFRDGEGPMETGFDVIESLQVKGNITKEFEDGTGFIRAYLKIADTQEPNYTGAPFTFDSDGASPGGGDSYPGFDGQSQINYSAHHQNMLVLEPSGFRRVDLNGISTKQFAIGFEFERDLDQNFKVNNKFRWQDISGAFSNPFFSVQKASDVIDMELKINGDTYATVGEIRYANGPDKGKVFTGTYVDSNAIFRTDVDDLSSYVNDLTVSGEFDTDAGTLTTLVGFFYMNQTIATNWKINRGYREIKGDNAASLDLFDGTGADANALSKAGIAGYNNNWGACCARDYDLSYVNTAPYVALELDDEMFNADVSIRIDSVAATGTNFGGGQEFFVDPSGANMGSDHGDYQAGMGYIVAMLADGDQEVLDYSVDYTSWTIGGLYKFDQDTSFFARISKGNRFNADRQTNGGNFNGDGSLTQKGDTAAVDEVNQLEAGVKYRGMFDEVDYSVEFTLLKGDFSQNTFEIDGTGQRCPGGAGTCVLSNEYESSGFELYGNLAWQTLTVIGTATYTDAKVKGSAATSFTEAERIPKFQYSFAGNYEFNEYISGGLSWTGQTEIMNAGKTWDGVNTFSGFVRARPIENIVLGLDLYNLFDNIAFREGASIADDTPSRPIGTANPVVGRTIRASVTYEF